MQYAFLGALIFVVPSSTLDVGRPAEKYQVLVKGGKVVVLNFWASWCGPCMAMVPHERSLMKHWEGKPFILLGFNGDDDTATARRVAQREGMNWRSWWERGRHATIIRRWNVVSWPTTYVLDAQGVIRYEDVRGPELDQAIDLLMREIDGTRVGKH